MRRHSRQDRAPRKGGMTIPIALGVVVLVGASALVVDIGYTRVLHAQLQLAADAAALAGARQLDGTTTGIVKADTVGRAMAAQNEVGGEAIVLGGNDLTVGAWDGDTTMFSWNADLRAINAVKVKARKLDVPPMLALLAFGREPEGITAEATATQGLRLGASVVPYYIPLGVPDCRIKQWSTQSVVDQEFVLSPAGVDNVGWAMIGSAANASRVQSLLTLDRECISDFYAKGRINFVCTAIASGDTLYLGNGAQASSLSAMASELAMSVPWDSKSWGTIPAQHSGSALSAANYGKMLAGPFPVFKAPANYCTTGGAWNESLPIVGFVWGAIYDVRTTGAAADKNVWARLDPGRWFDVGTYYGAEDFGVVYRTNASLVQ